MNPERIETNDQISRFEESASTTEKKDQSSQIEQFLSGSGRQGLWEQIKNGTADPYYELLEIKAAHQTMKESLSSPDDDEFRKQHLQDSSFQRLNDEDARINSILQLAGIEQISKEALMEERIYNPELNGDFNADVESYLRSTDRAHNIPDIRSGNLEATRLLSDIKKTLEDVLADPEPPTSLTDKQKQDYQAEIDWIAQIQQEQGRERNDDTNQTEVKQSSNENEEKERQVKEEMLNMIRQNIEQKAQELKNKTVVTDERRKKDYLHAREVVSRIGEAKLNLISKELPDKIEKQFNETETAFRQLPVLLEGFTNNMRNMVEIYQTTIDFVSTEQIRTFEGAVDNYFKICETLVNFDSRFDLMERNIKTLEEKLKA